MKRAVEGKGREDGIVRLDNGNRVKYYAFRGCEWPANVDSGAQG